MPCFGCEQNNYKDKAYDSILSQAKTLAFQNNEWYVIYEETKGEYKTIKADEAKGLPIIQYVSPKLQNSSSGNLL